MCGRTCLTLEPAQIVCACKYKSNDQKRSSDNTSESAVKDESAEAVDYETPEWRSEFNCGRKYIPSYNIAPTDITPVLVSADYFYEAEEKAVAKQEQKRVLMPMMWGMIPFWHKGDYRKHGLTTNNCRLEHMLESKLYRGPFRRGQRCVVLCEGFYEWQTTKTAKPSERAAYLLHMPQEKAVNIYDKTTWTPDNVNLLKMAGIFDVWEDENGDKIFSYSVITFESSKLMSWLHHRMPAILETEQQVDDWLDFKRVTDEQALATLRPATLLKWHRVSNLVNNSRNKSDQCNKPIELAETKKLSVTPANKTMLNWLIRKSKTAELSDEDDDSASGAGANTSESDAENSQNPRKRRRFLSSKKNIECTAVKTPTQDESSDKSNQNDKN